MAFNLLVLFALLFVLSHVGMSSDRLKRALVQTLGERTFMGIYSLVALLTLGGTILIYAGFGARGPLLWVPLGWSNPLVYVLMLLAFLFLVLSMATPSPVGMETGAKPISRGVLRVTAHPQNWGMICFGIAHVLVTGTAGGLVMYGSFAALGIVGAYHETAKKSKDVDEAVKVFMKETGVIPFSAILRGRNKFVAGEFGIASILIALAAFGASIGIHFLL
jgi:uncharacterized membrane protein